MWRFAKRIVLFFISAHAWGGDIILIRNHAELATVPKVQKALKQLQEKVLEPSLHPLIPTLQDDVKLLAELLQSDEEKADHRPIYVVLTRSAQENMSFVRLKDGTRFIIANIGFLGNSEEDSDIAFVKGHEYQHGWSQLEAFLDQHNDNSLFKRLAKRGVENEVDMKSVFLRMIPAGADPYAAERVLRRFRKKYGSGIGEHHTATSSREDTLAIALAGARRELGQRIDIEPVVTLPTKIVETIRATDFWSKDYESVIARDLESEFQELPRLIKRLFPWISDSNAEKVRTYAERGEQPFGFESRDSSPYGNEQWHWDSYVSSQLKYPASAEVYRHLRHIHIRTFAKSYIEGFDEYFAKRKKRLSQNEFARHLRLMKAPDLADLREIRVKEVEDAKEYVEVQQGHVDKDKADGKLEIDERYVDDAKKKLAYAEQTLALFDEEAVIWSEFEKEIRERRARLLADNHKLVTPHIGNETAILDLVGTSRESDIWKVAKSYLSNTGFQGVNDGSFDHSEHRLWERLYALDSDKATELWKYFLGRQVKYLAVERNQHIYAAECLTLISHIRKKLDSFKAYPKYEAALASELQPAVVAFFNNLLTPRVESDDNRSTTLDERWRRYASSMLHQLGEKYLEFEPKIREFVTASILPAGYRADFEASLPSRIRELYRLYLETVPSDISIELSPEDFLVILAIKQNPEREATWKALVGNTETRRETIVRLSHKLAGDIVTAKFIKSSFSGLANFYRLIRIFDPKTPEEKTEFYRLIDRLNFNHQISYDRPREVLLPFLDWDMELYAGYMDWLSEHHPDEKEKLKEMFELPHVPNSYSYSTEGLNDQQVADLKKAHEDFNDKISKQDKKPIIQRRDAYILREIKKHFEATGGDAPAVIKEIDKEFGTVISNSNLPRYLDMFPSGATQALAAILPEHRRVLDQTGEAKAVIEWMDARLTRPDIAIDDLKNIAQAFVTIAEHSRLKGVERDAFFQRLWEKGGEPVREILAQQTVVAHLLSHAEKRRVLQWCFNREVVPLIAGRAPDLKTIRPSVSAAKALLERLLPSVGTVRDELIDEWAEDLVTNPAETDLLFSLETNRDNWYESQGIALLDFPQAFNHHMPEKHKKMAFLKFFIGQIDSEELIKALGDGWGGFTAQGLPPIIQGMMIRYKESPIFIRLYVLMSLLDDLHGLLSDESYSEQVYRIILGPYADNEVAEAALHAYLDSVPKSERRVLLARILAGMIDNTSGRGYVRSIVDGLKTLAYKGAQSMRAAGLVSKEMEPEFEGVFDRAIRPRRNVGLKRFRQAFGEDLTGLTYFGPLIGYGSVNFVYGSEFENPEEAGATLDVAIRALHENVVGQIRNEAQVWERAIPKLESDPRLPVRIMGGYLRDCFNSAMETLKEGGSEVDLREDRKLIAEATPVYRRDASKTRSGYAIKVVPVLQSIQDRVNKAVEDSVSAHPWIRFKKIADHPLGKSLSLDATEVETEAAYQLGEFDLDGHPGNYFADSGNEVLWRADVSQFRKIKNKELVALQRRAMQILLKPMFSYEDTSKLAQLAPILFREASVPDVSRETLIETFHSLLDAYGSSEPNAILNLYFYRRKLDAALNAHGALRFTPETVWYIQTVSRNRIQSETSGMWGYYRTLGKALGKDPVTTTLEFGVHAIKRCADTVFEAAQRPILLRKADDGG